MVFLKIGEIDTLKEQYSADTFIQAKWREPALDGKSMEVTTPLSTHPAHTEYERLGNKVNRFLALSIL